MVELALPYVPIDPQIEDSERYGAFVDALELYDDPNAPWKIIALLLWTGRTRPDGHIGKPTDRKLASICRWPGDPAELRAALVSAGWLVDDGAGGYVIEGWDRHGGRVLEQRVRWRKNKQNQRGKKVSTGTSQRRPEDIPETSPGCLDVSQGRPRLKGEGEGEGKKERDQAPRDFDSWTPGEWGAIDQLTAVQVEAHGFTRYGSAGANAPTLRALCPILGQEMTDAMNSGGESWGYFFKVMGTIRKRAAIPRPPPARTKHDDAAVGYHPGSDWTNEKPGIQKL